MTETTTLPSPYQVARHIVRLLFDWHELREIGLTCMRTFCAFTLSLLCSVVMAVAAQSSDILQDTIRNLMAMVLRIPSIAIVTFCVLLTGAGKSALFLAVAAVVVPVTTLALMSLYTSIPDDLHAVNRVYRVPFFRQAVWLYGSRLLSGIHPIFTLSYSLSFKALIMAEFLGGFSGMGYELMLMRDSLDLGSLAAYILIIAAAGYMSQKLLEILAQWGSKRYAASR
ncbi:MAG: ABC transporter permease subunit [Thermodesulfobacteriota bacterium]